MSMIDESRMFTRAQALKHKVEKAVNRVAGLDQKGPDRDSRPGVVRVDEVRLHRFNPFDRQKVGGAVHLEGSKPIEADLNYEFPDKICNSANMSMGPDCLDIQRSTRLEYSDQGDGTRVYVDHSARARVTESQSGSLLWEPL